MQHNIVDRVQQNIVLGVQHNVVHRIQHNIFHAIKHNIACSRGGSTTLFTVAKQHCSRGGYPSVTERCKEKNNNKRSSFSLRYRLFKTVQASENTKENPMQKVLQTCFYFKDTHIN